jgi:hypothetical protein
MTRNLLNVVIPGLLAGLVLTLCTVEITLRMLPVGDGLFAADPSPGWPAYRLTPHSRYTYSEGWNLQNVRYGSINNMGFAAPFDYVPGSSGIVVIGDSFIEGLMNEYSSRLQGQLDGLLVHPRAIFNFGYSGTSLTDYLGMSGLVGSRFKAQWLIVLVVPGDFVDGFHAGPGSFYWSRGDGVPVHLVPDERERSSLRKWLRTLAIVRYAKGQLGASVQTLIHTRPVRQVTACTSQHLESGDDKLIQSFMQYLPATIDLPPSRIILIFDPDVHPGPPQSLRGGRSTCPTRDGMARALLAQIAENSGAHVIDMAPIFAAYYRATGQRVDHADSHWNGTGHWLAAREVANIINREEVRSQ